MKKIEVIEKKSVFNLSFSTPETNLNKEQLSKLIGGSAGCECKKQALTSCMCFHGAVLEVQHEM
ncbi:MAG: hypothetical protein KAT68_09095 [Bacteroidales bacterium]|nr:hypothetical protein [Bacteroidales bacterium]